MPVPEVAFSDTASFDASAAVEYRAVSPLALAALGLGLLSMAALAHPLLWCLPLLGTVVSLVAWRQLLAPECLVAGRPLALLGLVLSLVFAGAAPARQYSRTFVLQREARQVAESWLERVRQGQLNEAYELHLTHTARQPPGIDLAAFYEASQERREQLTGFFKREPLAHLKNAGEAAQIRFVRLSGLADAEEDASSTVVVLDFEIDGPQGTRACRIFARRRLGPENSGNWEVMDVVEPAQK